MNYEQTRAALESYFSANYLDTDVAYENVEFKTSKGTPWVEFRIIDGNESLLSLASEGNRMYRRTGLVSVKVFTAENTGTKQARDLADKIAGLFRTKSISGAIFGSPNIARRENKDGWLQTTVTISFYVDSIY